jgi:hypothetical protein
MDYLSPTEELHMHFFFLIIPYSFLHIDDFDANNQGISLSSWHPCLNPTHVLNAISMKYSFM